jgi:hypothetical protein
MRVLMTAVGALFAIVGFGGQAGAQTLVGDGVVAPACMPWVEESALDPTDVDYSGSQQWVEEDADINQTVTLFLSAPSDQRHRL